MWNDTTHPQNQTERAASTDSDIIVGRSEDAEILTDGGEDLVTIERSHAETLLEAAGSLRDDIASGRQWGVDETECRENAGKLDEAYDTLRTRLRSSVSSGSEIVTDGGESERSHSITTLGCRLRGRQMFSGGSDDGTQ